LRLISVVLVATSMVVAGCSMLMPAVMADYHGDFKSTEDTGVTSNLGKIRFADCTVPPPGDYSLPQVGLGVGSGTPPYTATITYLPASGYRFVKWGTSGGASVANPLSQTTVLTLTQGGYTVTAVYQKGESSVGGVVLPANTSIALAPYLVMIGLVVTAAIAVKKRKN